MSDYQDLSRDQIVMGFVASCVEDVANRLGVAPAEIYRRMDAVQMIDGYLMAFYETLHTESRENLTDSLIDLLKRREVQKDLTNKQVVRQILLWQQIGCIVVALANKLGITYKKALDMFYASRTSERLHDERSGLYLMSDGYIVDEVLMEQQGR